MASSTIPIDNPIAKQITLQAPAIYEEVLAIIPPRLFSPSVTGPLYGFFLDVIESYIPTLLGDIRGYCTGDDNRDALLQGEDAVHCLARRVAVMRGLPSDAYELVDPAYALVIEAFAAAHSEEFHPEGAISADEWEAWKRGVGR
jgi:hypothetical protein